MRKTAILVPISIPGITLVELTVARDTKSVYRQLHSVPERTSHHGIPANFLHFDHPDLHADGYGGVG